MNTPVPFSGGRISKVPKQNWANCVRNDRKRMRREIRSHLGSNSDPKMDKSSVDERYPLLCTEIPQKVSEG